MYVVILLMTVLGEKNHHNVELLKGYSISISLKDKRVCLKGGRDVFTGKQEVKKWAHVSIETSSCKVITRKQVMKCLQILLTLWVN